MSATQVRQTAGSAAMSDNQSRLGVETVGATITGFGLSYAITAVFNVLLVIVKEKSAAVHDFMAALTGHHWITHGVFDLIVFVVLGLILARTAAAATMPAGRLINYVVWSTILSGLAIAVFFTVA
jgi:hypothetical protein